MTSVLETEAFAPLDAYFALFIAQSDESIANVPDCAVPREALMKHWHAVYGKRDDYDGLLSQFISKMQSWRQSTARLRSHPPPDLHKTAIVYGMYVDLFGGSGGFDAATDKLAHLAELGVDCVWLLPVLQSPLLDAGFDISDYHAVRTDLGGIDAFQRFIDAAHARQIHVLFDVAINHCSSSHRWFVDASTKGDSSSPFNDFFFWSRDASEFAEARIIFRGIETSNWEQLTDGRFYFHRFFKHQPDLNYRNPAVLLIMTSVLLFWAAHGVDGFRLDAVPCLWKEGSCESQPQVHSIIKFFRAALDFVRPNTFLLAEACQEPRDVIQYFGNGDECHAAYHFPLMPAIFLSLARQNGTSIANQMRALPSITGHWFTFLRVHDEMTLEMVSPDVCEELLRAYLHDNTWDFRDGLGISARLADLLKNDARRILLAYSIELTLIGTPLIMYGDEVAKRNDVMFYEEQLIRTGLNDTRYLVRGRINWAAVDAELANPSSTGAQVFSGLSAMIRARRQLNSVFALGDITIVEHNAILAYRRCRSEQSVLVVHNLSDREQEFVLPSAVERELFRHNSTSNVDVASGTTRVSLQPFGITWFVEPSK